MMIKHISPVFSAALLAYPLCAGIAPAAWAMGHPQDPSYTAPESSEAKEAKELKGQRPHPQYHTAAKEDGPATRRGNCLRPGNCQFSQEPAAMQP